jgi:hypothetical protein
MGTKRIAATEIRFIKLGGKGEWEEMCIEGPNPCIRLGFRSNQHKESLAGNWEAIHNYWHNTEEKSLGKATEYTNQVKAFYTLDENTIWITFYKRKLFWCRASSKVIELQDKTRIRKTIGKWSSQDIGGHELHIDNLSGALTKVQGFRGTICRVDAADYLLKKINGETSSEIIEAEKSLHQLEQSLEILIQKLGWKDLELLTDMIFTQAGWQRLSSLGKTQKSIDLDLLSPVTGKRAFVQVKSKADLETFLRYKSEFESMNQYDEMYFVVHSPSQELAAYSEQSDVVLLTVDRLAKLVVSAGLTNWLIRKTS